MRHARRRTPFKGMNFQFRLLRSKLKRHLSQGPGFFDGINWALARKGIIVKDKVFQNLEIPDLQREGATVSESLSGFPMYVRGSFLGGASEISKAQFSKLLKQVTSHMLSISSVFIHDGAIGLSLNADAKVRVISDSPSAVLSLTNILWKVPARAVSHDSCPLTVYATTSISPKVADSIALEAKGYNGFMAADIECSSLILCGKAFADTNATKDALTALSEPVITARGGLPLSARLLVFGDSVILLFAPEDTIQSCATLFLSRDVGVVLSSKGVVPLFQTGRSSVLFKLPAAVVFVSSDCSGSIPSVSKLSPGQAAYHFLAGYQNGQFMPAYNKGPSSIDPIEHAKALLSKLKDDQIPAFLVNINDGPKNVSGKDLLNLVLSTLSKNIAPFENRGGKLQEKYEKFFSKKFKEIPKEFSF